MSEALYSIAVEVNGTRRAGQVSARTSLVDWLREHLNLTGTHIGCEHGICGACSIMLDGEPVRSCLMYAVQADGHRITTVEGLAQPDGRLSVLGALAALAEQAATLLLGGAAPDAVALAVGEGVLEARLTHRADGTDALRLPGIVVRGGVEDRRVQTAAGPFLTPGQVHDCVLPS